MAAIARSFWLSWFLVISVSALPWNGPQQTFSATATADWSPAPTKEAHELFKRDSYPVSLCGWQGPQYQGVYCSTGSSCAWFTDYSVVGCCSIGGYCDAVYTGCIDGNHPPQSVSYPGVYTCSSNAVCYSNSYPGGYYQVGCGSTSVGENVVTSWTGINPQFSIVIVYTGGVLENEAPVTLISPPAPSPSPVVSTASPPPPPPPPPPSTTATEPPPTTASSMAPSPPPSTPTIFVTPSTSSTTTTPTISSVSDTPTVPLVGTTSSKKLSISSTPSTFLGTTSSATSASSNSASALPGIIPTPSQSSSKGLSTGAKAGIGVGVVLGVIAIIAGAFIIWWCCFRNRKRGPAPNLINDYDDGGHEVNVPPPVPVHNSEKTYNEPDQGYYAPPKETPDASVAASIRPQSVVDRGNTESPAPAYERSPIMNSVPRIASVPNMHDFPTNRSVRPVPAAVPELD